MSIWNKILCQVSKSKISIPFFYAFNILILKHVNGIAIISKDKMIFIMSQFLKIGAFKSKQFPRIKEQASFMHF